MDLVPLVSAADLLMTPPERGSREAWLLESARRVREACGARDAQPSGPADELEALLRLPGDLPGWLRAALESADPEPATASLPDVTEGSDALLRVVTLRCALAAGIASLHPARAAPPLFGEAIDPSVPSLPTTQELRVSFGLRGREPQVALLAAEGLSNADIAARLRLSAHTVRHYLERVLDRLGLHTRKALTLRLMRKAVGGKG